MTHKPFDLEKAMRNGGKCMTVNILWEAEILRQGLAVAVVGFDLMAVLLTNIRDKFQVLELYDKRGRCIGSDRGRDLINTPEKRTGWIGHCTPRIKNIFRHTTDIFETLAQLETWIDNNRHNISVDEWIIQEISWEGE